MAPHVLPGTRVLAKNLLDEAVNSVKQVRGAYDPVLVGAMVQALATLAAADAVAGADAKQP